MKWEKERSQYRNSNHEIFRMLLNTFLSCGTQQAYKTSREDQSKDIAADELVLQEDETENPWYVLRPGDDIHTEACG